MGNVHNDNLPLRNIALQYVIQNNMHECPVVFSDDFLHSMKIKKKFVEFTQTIKFVALTVT